MSGLGSRVRVQGPGRRVEGGGEAPETAAAAACSSSLESITLRSTGSGRREEMKASKGAVHERACARVCERKGEGVRE
eukprot:1719985-Rhodomonas_salina.1